MNKLRKLFEPGSIGEMSLRNRIVMPPTGTGYSSKEGYVTQRLKDYYEERAKGGAGLIISELVAVESQYGKLVDNELAIDDDRFIPGLSELVQVIQKHGAKVAIQLHHAGRGSIRPGIQPVAPSAIAQPGRGMPRELTVGEIEALVVSYAKGAERAKKVGFDGIELYAAHQYLLAQFLSAASNRRRDAYGGDIKGRSRLLLQILSAIKRVVGQGYPVWCRINAMEYGIEDGLTLDEGKEVARMAEDAGADGLHVSAYGSGGHAYYMPIPIPHGTIVHLAEEIKKVVSVPVITVGRINLELAEKILEDEKADLICLGRALIADPELPNKAASGRLDDINPCIACLRCLDSLFEAPCQLICSVNAAVGKEREYTIRPTKKRKKILVVGGGPAGMEAARVTKLRGHEVVLIEKDQTLGGQLIVAARSPDKDRIQPLTNYLTTQVNKLGVRVELGKEATPELIEETKPDVVILATGVVPFIPEIRGIEKSNVVSAVDVLAGRVEVGERVVVMGGELVGCETAAFLAEKGKKITITRRGPRMAAEMSSILRRHLLDLLRTKEVTMLTGVKYDEITDSGLIIIDKEGKRRAIEVDTIVIAAGARPNTALVKGLEDKVAEIHLIGDCLKPQTILEAISDGSRIARAL